MSKLKNILTLTFSASHSLILGHKPDKLSLKNIGDKLILEKHDTENFGLFDTSTPNYTTYYPDVTATDLKPTEGEFIYPVFRLLSEVILNTYNGPVDFTKPGVLKKSRSLLVGQTINVDHETAIGNAIGSVMETEWQESYSSTSGVKIPAGINGTFKIDGKSNPRIARGIMMEPPSIHSNSVSVTFEWEQSHPKMDASEFRSKLGQHDSKGELIRRVVSKVTAYHETSLVSHGADSFAQRVSANGEINNPKYANTINKNLSVNPFIIYDWKNTVQLEQVNNQINVDMENLINLIKLAEKYNFKPAEGKEITLEDLTAHIDSLISTSENLISENERLTTEVETLKEEKTGLETEITSLKESSKELSAEDKANLALGESQLKLKREEAVRLYKLVNADKPDANIITTIENSNIETAESFITTYQKDFDEKFPLQCQKCHSTEISHRSSVAVTGTKSLGTDFKSLKDKAQHQKLEETSKKMHS
jgi:regulator of replication initiation timing